jgi:hypothetical protein
MHPAAVKAGQYDDATYTVKAVADYIVAMRNLRHRHRQELLISKGEALKYYHALKELEARYKVCARRRELVPYTPRPLYQGEARIGKRLTTAHKVVLAVIIIGAAAWSVWSVFALAAIARAGGVAW